MSPTTQLQNASRRGVRFAIRSEGACDAGCGFGWIINLIVGRLGGVGGWRLGCMSELTPQRRAATVAQRRDASIANQRGRDRHHMGESIARGHGLVNWGLTVMRVSGQWFQ